MAAENCINSSQHFVQKNNTTKTYENEQQHQQQQLEVNLRDENPRARAASLSRESPRGGRCFYHRGRAEGGAAAGGGTHLPASPSGGWSLAPQLPPGETLRQPGAAAPRRTRGKIMARRRKHFCEMITTLPKTKEQKKRRKKTRAHARTGPVWLSYRENHTLISSERPEAIKSQ